MSTEVSPFIFSFPLYYSSSSSSSSTQAARNDNASAEDNATSLDTFDHIFLFGDTGSCCHLLDEDGKEDNSGEVDSDSSSSINKSSKAAALVEAGPSGWRRL
jgi:hypothetical protein